MATESAARAGEHGDCLLDMRGIRKMFGSFAAVDGVDLQVMCATPVLFAYARPAAQALYCAQLFNDAGLELAAQGKGRLRTLCQVPLQDTDAACRELSRAMKAGHLGVQIGNHVGERDLDDEGILTFLEHCAAEGAAVLVHPWDMMGGARTARWMMGCRRVAVAKQHCGQACSWR